MVKQWHGISRVRKFDQPDFQPLVKLDGGTCCGGVGLRLLGHRTQEKIYPAIPAFGSAQITKPIDVFLAIRLQVAGDVKHRAGQELLLV